MPMPMARTGRCARGRVIETSEVDRMKKFWTLFYRLAPIMALAVVVVPAASWRW
jgi:hypothetical protein